MTLYSPCLVGKWALLAGTQRGEKRCLLLLQGVIASKTILFHSKTLKDQYSELNIIKDSSFKVLKAYTDLGMKLLQTQNLHL